MYEMYPEAWTANDQRRPTLGTIRPQRRTRKAHSVLPPVLTLPNPVSERDRSAA